MVDVEALACLHESREGDSGRFPEDELDKLTSAVEAVDESTFHDTRKGREVNFDREIASSLNGYVSGPNTEYQLWRDFKMSVDLYNPDSQIAVEIEKTEKKLVWKNLIKFSRGKTHESDGQIEFGCIIVPVNYPGGGNIFRHATNALEFTSPLIPIQDVVVVGYRDPRDDYSA
jgi:hypothetical protein